MALDVEFDRCGVEWLAVLELDTGAQLDDEPLVAVRPLPFGRQLRDDLQLGTDIDELVAQRREDDAADIGSGKRRVEDIGVRAETNPQCLRRGRYYPYGRDRRDQAARSHLCPPLGHSDLSPLSARIDAAPFVVCKRCAQPEITFPSRFAGWGTGRCRR